MQGNDLITRLQGIDSYIAAYIRFMLYQQSLNNFHIFEVPGESDVQYTSVRDLEKHINRVCHPLPSFPSCTEADTMTFPFLGPQSLQIPKPGIATSGSDPREDDLLLL